MISSQKLLQTNPGGVVERMTKSVPESALRLDGYRMSFSSASTWLNAAILMTSHTHHTHTHTHTDTHQFSLQQLQAYYMAVTEGAELTSLRLHCLSRAALSCCWLREAARL